MTVATVHFLRSELGVPGQSWIFEVGRRAMSRWLLFLEKKRWPLAVP